MRERALQVKATHALGEEPTVSVWRVGLQNCLGIMKPAARVNGGRKRHRDSFPVPACRRATASSRANHEVNEAWLNAGNL